MNTAITIMLYTTLLTAIVAFAVSGLIFLLCKLIQITSKGEGHPHSAATVHTGGEEEELALVIAIVRHHAEKS